jgi:carbon-monoxide dehydrogenase large subunit
VQIDRYAPVDDVGRAINPLILHGQTHGNCPRGWPGASREQLLRASERAVAGGKFHGLRDAACRYAAFVGYGTQRSPSAVEPARRTFWRRGGTTPALAAVINAIVDRLAELGVRHIEMPATSERVWRAIREGDAAAAVRSRSGAQ